MKRIMLLLVILNAHVGAVNFPEEKEKRGLKRYVEEISPQQTPDEMIFEAVHAGDTQTLQQLLNQTGYTINRRYHDGQTLLIYAAAAGQNNIVNYLIGAGADVNMRDDFGMSALHYASNENHVAIVLRLLQQDNLDLNLRSNLGNTPLFSAILNESTGVVNILLTPINVQRGLNINVATNDQFSPVGLAILKDDLVLLNRLLQLGVQPGFVLPDVTALQYAVGHQRERIVERLLLMPGLDVNQKNEKGETALMFAALLGNLNIARLLIAKGARVALKDEDGSTALDFAKASDSPQKNAMIKLLLDAKKSQRR